MLCQRCEDTVRLSLADPCLDPSSGPQDVSSAEDAICWDVDDFWDIDEEATSLRSLLQAATHGCFMCKTCISQDYRSMQQRQHLLTHLRNNTTTDLVLTRKAIYSDGHNERGSKLWLQHSGELLIDGEKHSFDTTDAYTLRPCDAAPVRPTLVPPNVRSSTGDEAVLQLLERWLADCLANHPLCPGPNSADPPSRLIDTNANGLEYFQIVNVSADMGSPRYFTLSHRWGYDTPTLRQDNADRYRTGVAWRELPGLYQDVFRVVNALGYRYVWIDSLCIFQDDRLDMLNEGLTMAKVYSAAVCNVVAAEAQTEKLFATRHPETLNPFVDIPSLRVGHSSITLRLEHDSLWSREVQGAPIAKRGWVLQEQLLAPRTLYFGANEVFWDCCTGRRSETYPSLAEVYAQGDTNYSIDWFEAPPGCMAPLWSNDAPLNRFVRSSNASLMGSRALEEIESGVSYDIWSVSTLSSWPSSS